MTGNQRLLKESRLGGGGGGESLKQLHHERSEELCRATLFLSLPESEDAVEVGHLELGGERLATQRGLQ